MYMNDGIKTKINLRNKSVFITGVAGFIGSNLAKRLLSTVEGVKVVGLDNMNHYYDTETKKAELFAKVRSGQVRILLGSTPKLGAGTNIQDRLIALHHLDCPWKPSDLEQQEGRILRQGNRNQKVKIFRYVTENTFDSYMWQILENKQKFISQIMTSKSPVRACDDVDDTALTYAEIKALATGNPYIKEKMDLDIQVSKLKLMRANHTSQIYSLESDIARRYPAEITAAKERIAGLKADLAVAKPLLEQDKEKFSITVEDRVYTDRKEAGSAILAACAAMKIAKTEGQIADLGGFAISSRFDAFAQTFKLTIKRQSSYTIELGSDPAGNMGYILAYTLNYNSHDGRYSHSNREWADTTCKGERGSNIRTDWIVRSHPAVLNGFVDMYRKELAAEQQREPEKPFVQQFYVVTDLQTNPMKIEKFGNLDDAMSCYQQVPNFHLKALGVEKTPDPLPGSLDIVQCKNGIDTIVEDYKKVPGWDNPYIQNHVVALVAEALKVQDVAVAYEINDD